MLAAGFVLTMVRGCSMRVLSRRGWRGDLIEETIHSSAHVVVEHCEVLSGGISVRSSDTDEIFHGKSCGNGQVQTVSSVVRSERYAGTKVTGRSTAPELLSQ